MNDPLTICLVRWNANYQKQAGVTTISLQLAKAWRKLGCRIVWVGPRPPREFDGILDYVDAEPTTEALITGGTQALDKYQIDVMATFEPFIEGPAAAHIRRNLGIPYAHFGMHFADDEEARKAESLTYSTADMLVYQCNWFLREYVTPRLGTVLAADKPSLVVPFGADIEWYRPLPQGGTHRELPIVLFVGRLNRENCTPPEYDKGAAYLVDAIPELLAQNHNARFIFVGDGPQLPQLKQQAHNLGISQFTEFVGELTSRDLLLQHMRSASIFTLPSVCDVFPVAILEALSSGLPVVSTRVGGIPECVTDACGILVEPRNANALAAGIGKLLSSPDLRSEMGQQGRAVAVARFDWNAAAARMLNFFREILR